MAKKLRATEAKNNFGGMLEDVMTFGRVEIVRHGRVVAVVLSPRELERMLSTPQRLLESIPPRRSRLPPRHWRLPNDSRLPPGGPPLPPRDSRFPPRSSRPPSGSRVPPAR